MVLSTQGCALLQARTACAIAMLAAALSAGVAISELSYAGEPDRIARWAAEEKTRLEAEKADLETRHQQAVQALQRSQVALARSQQANNQQAIAISQQAVQAAQQAIENLESARRRNLNRITGFNRAIQWGLTNSGKTRPGSEFRGVLASFTPGELLVQTSQGVWRPFDGQRPLMVGEVFRTTNKGRAEFRFDDGSLVILDRNTEFELSKRTDCLSLYQLFKGTIHGEFKQPRRKLDIRSEEGGLCAYVHHYATPIAAAAVRGTSFEFKFEPDGSTSLKVYEGEVELKSSKGDQKVAVRRGERAIVRADGALIHAGKDDVTATDRWWEKL